MPSDIERWTLIGQVHDSHSHEWLGMIRGPQIGPDREVEVVPASQLEGAVGALDRIAAESETGIRMSAEMAQIIAAGALNRLRERWAEPDAAHPAQDCPHPAWDHEAEACVACGAAPSRAVVERDQEIADLETQLAIAVRENEQLRAEAERLNNLLVAQGESCEQKRAEAERSARPATRNRQPELGDSEPA